LGKAYEAGEKNIPFHRIVYSGGRVWTNAAYDEKRRKLYKKEGIKVEKTARLKISAKCLKILANQ